MKTSANDDSGRTTAHVMAKRRDRLVPLSTVSANLRGHPDADWEVLTHCADAATACFVAVPPDRDVVVYANVITRKSRWHDARLIEHRGHARIVDGEMLTHFAVGAALLRRIRDQGCTTVVEFMDGGLARGLARFPFDCAVSHPRVRSRFVNGHWSEYIPSGAVDAQPQKLAFEDLLVFERDAEQVLGRIELEGTADPFDLRIRAPSMFVLYQVSRLGLDEVKGAEELKLRDKLGVFTGIIAEGAARIAKKNGRKHVEKCFDTRKLSNNELGKDYRDPDVSLRTSFMVLACDVWLHDRPLYEQRNALLDEIRRTTNAAADTERDQKKRAALLEKGRQQELTSTAHLVDAMIIKPGSSLEKYLSLLGFPETQHRYLTPIIKGRPKKADLGTVG